MINHRDNNSLWPQLCYMQPDFLMELSKIPAHVCEMTAQFRFLKIQMDTEGGLDSRQQ